jgi:putative ABC transport system permease protein
MLVGISATESVTLVVFPLLLVAVEPVAAYVPARRASKVDPTIALRCD